MEVIVFIATIIAAIILVFLYFLPAFVAHRRGHKNTVAIFMLNLLLGWTFLGWAVAAVWAFTDDVEKAD